MKWTIDKTFSFAYGHRVWSQELNADFAGSDMCLACRHLHGHEGTIKVFLEADELASGMVTDFKHLNWFKVFLDDVLDHKFIMDINDPLIPHELPEYCKHEHTSGTVSLPVKKLDLLKCIHHADGYWTPDLALLDSALPTAVREKYEGMVLVDFVPTSENISAWLLEVCARKMEKINVKVQAIEFWETSKSHCRVTS